MKYYSAKSRAHNSNYGEQLMPEAGVVKIEEVSIAGVCRSLAAGSLQREPGRQTVVLTHSLSQQMLPSDRKHYFCHVILDLQHQLLTMARQDQQAAERILLQGDLEDTYHAELEDIHIANAKRLEEIIKAYGLPGKSLVDADGAEAVWLIIQHAISLPAFQRKCLPLLQEASAKGEFPAAYAAYLEDRNRFHEGKPQRYGTQYDWDEAGQLSPYTIEDLGTVDELRAGIGLSSLADNTARMRSHANQPPKDYQSKKIAYENWLRKVGWRKAN
jgi:hypothetical protein